MTISRYKIMAGILGVSLGGLAAVAGQCPRPTTHRSDAPPGDPKVPNAGSKPSALPSIDLPPAAPATSPVGVDLPALPVPALPATAPAKLPELPPVTPVKAELPKTPAIPTPVVIPAAGSTLPEVPPALPAVAAPDKAPAVIPPTPPMPKTTPSAVVPTAPTIDPIVPSAPTSTFVPTPATTPAVPPTPAVVEPAPAVRPAPAPAAQQAVPAANRFRILLRVGEGEPMFEVKSGDDLAMRVVCEKVDIKSPDKGTGPSSVIATGRVRFVGFGAEGTCESLSFLAGTGEVAMTGSVRVQVKDKIGRVESELTSDRLQYRLDAANLPGVMRP